jgi:hypothetical protein
MGKGEFLVWRNYWPVRQFSALDALTSADVSLFGFYTIIHPERDVPLRALERICERANELYEIPGSSVISKLLIRGDPIQVDARIGAIRGIEACQAETVFNLDRLPETMSLSGKETLGPLSRREMAKLRGAIRRRSGAFDADRRFRCALQVWDQSYIVSNSGAARRIALWRRLNHDANPTIPVTATPYHLNDDTLHWLRHDYRLLFCRHNVDLEKLFNNARLEGHPLYYVAPLWREDASAILALAPVHRARRSTRKRFEQIHGLVSHLFDLGRYLEERNSTYRFRHCHRLLAHQAE